MKRGKFLILLVLVLLILSGCGGKDSPDTRIPINIREIPGITVLNNGQFIQPGEDAEFLMTMDEGWIPVETDYSGTSRIHVEDGQIRLTLEDVTYPAHVSLKLTDRYVLITYEPNGGVEQSTTVAYDTSVRPRPNTSIGTDIFTREGYTLESWNTQPDGSGLRIGLGSRVTVPGESMTLYAQWAKWSDGSDFDWIETDGKITVIGYRGAEDRVVIPGFIEGKPVTDIAEGAFVNATMSAVILPQTMETVAEGAFQNCALKSLTLFDNIVSITDASLVDCTQLKTLYINAIEKPYGVLYRRETVYVDKVDMMIQAQGQKKVVFYSGCSIWYNLDGPSLAPLVEQGYRPINMGINGLVNSNLQMQIIEHFLEPGDIFFHAPEISSARQMMLVTSMDTENDSKLWCGLEYNYDLVTLVDVQTVPGILETFCHYLGEKKGATEYTAVYSKDGNLYSDEYGCIPFYRNETKDGLPDEVHMDPSFINDTGMGRLKAFYDRYQEKGVRVYVSYACFNMDEVVEEERGLVELVENRFRTAVQQLEGPVLISTLEDFLYNRDDFYDTNYHLGTEAAKANTAIWLRDLRAQMELDGLWVE